MLCRRSHQVHALKWDAAVASSAAITAGRCVFAVDPNEEYGENIFASTTLNATRALSDAIDFW